MPFDGLGISTTRTPAAIGTAPMAAPMAHEAPLIKSRRSGWESSWEETFSLDITAVGVAPFSGVFHKTPGPPRNSKRLPQETTETIINVNHFSVQESQYPLTLAHDGVGLVSRRLGAAAGSSPACWRPRTGASGWRLAAGTPLLRRLAVRRCRTVVAPCHAGFSPARPSTQPANGGRLCLGLRASVPFLGLGRSIVARTIGNETACSLACGSAGSLAAVEPSPRPSAGRGPKYLCQLDDLDPDFAVRLFGQPNSRGATAAGSFQPALGRAVVSRRRCAGAHACGSVGWTQFRPIFTPPPRLPVWFIKTAAQTT